MTIRKRPARHDPDNPLVTLVSLSKALEMPQVMDLLKKVLPQPDYDVAGMIETLNRISNVVGSDRELEARFWPKHVEIDDMASAPNPENVKPIPLRELVSDEERRRRRDMVVKVGRCLYGEAWQTPLARALSEAGGRPMTQNRIAHWLHDGVQARPVPGWIMPALRAVAEARIEELLRNVAEVRELYAAEDRGEVSAA
ncbi:hypothetical protein ABID82_004227 [Methylobacterium sp. PvP062]|uniref:Uncharacterized protein n=1 Tax=Methylobacterium radiotolerans TaxID=31998 RepID=A0ABV2NLB8_9HYPH|nr:MULTISPECIES: hypothetical protein [unclassified Methylobacterium]KZC01390.1 hypothetical protein AU375_02314 [Methylobacterium radiotolerans]MBP2495989.1 hypothetical protein [Methylobacterium sp. PvP105]MBP2504140.1 hypothetical protein [Methylobacterium sp. PvP109]MCX7333072.1 hypothetical protein [Hyphomicrobiales bacterium]